MSSVLLFLKEYNPHVYTQMKNTKAASSKRVIQRALGNSDLGSTMTGLLGGTEESMDAGIVAQKYVKLEKLSRRMLLQLLDVQGKPQRSELARLVLSLCQYKRQHLLEFLVRVRVKLRHILALVQQ